MIALVAALDATGLIGMGGRLPWHLPADMAHFRALTMGKVVIMGRKTHESIGRPLEGRVNVVVSRRNDAPWWSPVGGVVTTSLGYILSDPTEGLDKIVIGGAAVFAQAMPWADTLHLTRIGHAFPTGEGAVYFPAFDGFARTVVVERAADAANPWPMTFETWGRA